MIAHHNCIDNNGCQTSMNCSIDFDNDTYISMLGNKSSKQAFEAIQNDHIHKQILVSNQQQQKEDDNNDDKKDMLHDNQICLQQLQRRRNRYRCSNYVRSDGCNKEGLLFSMILLSCITITFLMTQSNAYAYASSQYSTSSSIGWFRKHDDSSRQSQQQYQQQQLSQRERQQNHIHRRILPSSLSLFKSRGGSIESSRSDERTSPSSWFASKSMSVTTNVNSNRHFGHRHPNSRSTLAVVHQYSPKINGYDITSNSYNTTSIISNPTIKGTTSSRRRGSTSDSNENNIPSTKNGRFVISSKVNVNGYGLFVNEDAIGKRNGVDTSINDENTIISTRGGGVDVNAVKTEESDDTSDFATDTTRVQFVAETKLPTSIGQFRLRAYKIPGSPVGYRDPCVIYYHTKPPPYFGIMNDDTNNDSSTTQQQEHPIPVRIHDQCITSEVFGSQR
jgi:GTP cyclohydrolase II